MKKETRPGMMPGLFKWLIISRYEVIRKYI